MTNDISNKALAKGPDDLESYSVPHQAQAVLQEGILSHDKILPLLPKDAKEHLSKIKFEGSPLPSLPINWRFAESIASLKGLEAIVLSSLLKRKYNVVPQEILINTDHAQLFIMSAVLWALDPQGENLSAMNAVTAEGRAKIAKYFPDCDLHDSSSSIYKGVATNIYKTKDGQFFHLHGSMDPRPSLAALGLPEDNVSANLQESRQTIADAVAKFESADLQRLVTDKYHQAGTICYSTDDFKNSEHGQANAHVGLWEISHHPSSSQKPSWWPDSPETSSQRPLAGLKVLDLTRIIAAPAVSRGLAELGASVMRVTGPDIADMSSLHPDLNHGKWNCHVDLKTESGRATLRELVLEADVFLQGYRPGVLDKYGFSEKDVLDLTKERQRGIIYVRENCYGWSGPWRDRSGWQQISDANTGVSLEYGRAMGNNEPVTPVFPNSDYSTGVIGVSAILSALIRRSEEGGSYTVSIALNYYSSFLVSSVGTYPPSIWADVHKRFGSPVFRHDDNMVVTLPALIKGVMVHSRHLLRPDFFTAYDVKNMGGLSIRYPAPVLQFPGGEVQPGFHIGTRGNGVDAPRWPNDLSVEVVA